MVRKKFNKQECIPVWCVPPALYRTREGGLCPEVSLSKGIFPGGGLCPGGLCPGRSLSRETPLWTGWQTRVKTLPCPKLRLQTVIMIIVDCDKWSIAVSNHSEKSTLFLIFSICQMFSGDYWHFLFRNFSKVEPTNDINEVSMHQWSMFTSRF